MSVDPLRFKPKLAVSTLEDDGDYRFFLSQNGQGLRFVPESHGADDPPSLSSDFGDFAKWVRMNDPSIPISVPDNTPRLLLRSADVWLPLVYLGADTSVQVLLNMASSYLYDKAKSALKHEKPRVHMSAVYQDKQAGKTKRFEFSGDVDDLARVIKKFDLNNFFDDTP